MLVKRFLPLPDETALNPKYQNAPCMKLFKQTRVKRIEKTLKFKEAKLKADSRKAAAERGNQTKAQKLKDFVENLDIKVLDISDEELLRRARENLNSIHDGNPPEISDEHMCVNFLRHQGTKYESVLGNLKGQVGRSDAYYEIKEKVLHEIGLAYPWLGRECDRQTEWMWLKQSQSL